MDVYETASEYETEDSEAFDSQTELDYQIVIPWYGKDDGSYFCPFCPGKKKRDYRYNEIIQHALGFERSPKVDKKTRKQHAIFAQELQESGGKISHDLKVETGLLNDQEVPKMEEIQYVFPWKAIVINLNRKFEKGQYVGPTKGEIKSKFSEFLVKDVKVLYGYLGHEGVALFEFENSMEGWEHAKSFEKSFEDSKRGLSDWINGGSENDVFGWILTKEDVERREKETIGNFIWPKSLVKLLSKCPTKSLSQIKSEEKVELEIKKKREMEWRISLRQENLNWAKQVSHLEEIIKNLEEKLVHSEKFPREKKIDPKLEEKHQKEQEKLEISIKKQRKNLELKQNREKISRQQKIVESDDSPKNVDLRENLEYFQELSGNLSNLNFSLISEKNEALKFALEVFKSKKMSNFLGKQKEKCGDIGIKTTGILNPDIWTEAGNKKFSSDFNVDFRIGEIISNWQFRVTDPSFLPFLIISKNKDVKCILEEIENEELNHLKDELGDEVVEDVLRAVKERDEFNSSGGYPTQVIWNNRKDSQASLEDVMKCFSGFIDFLVKELKTAKASVGLVKRKRGRRV